MIKTKCKVAEVLIQLDSVDSLKCIELKEQSTTFYLLIDMKEVGALPPIPTLLQTAKKLLDFCMLESQKHRLIAVSIMVKNDVLRKLMSTIVSMNRSICPSLVCLDIEEGREFGMDNAFLLSKR